MWPIFCQVYNCDVYVVMIEFIVLLSAGCGVFK